MLPRLVSKLCRRPRAQMPVRGAASCVRSMQDARRAGLGFVTTLLLLVLAVRAPFAGAQGLDPATLLKPATDTWPTYNGDYSGARFSTLDQINAGNVGSLALAWVFRAHGSVLKSTPLEVNGILYFSAPDNVWAVDARFGRQIWHYQRTSEGDHIGHRGLGMYKDWLYFTTPDAHLVCLDARDGKVRWDVELADVKLGYFSTMAPLVVRDHVIAGVSGDVTDVRGFLESIDPETGKIQWTWYTDPDPGQPGSETWPKDSDAILHGGGMTWMTGTYDPALNLLYWGTGNPNPVLAGEGRPGDNLYTCSIVALNPDTGKLVWYFQPSPHDVHDWDAVETPVLFDAEFKGKKRKLLAQASRNGFYFLLDRTPVRTAPPIGWRPALIPRPICSTSTPAASSAFISAPPPAKRKAGAAATAISGRTQPCARSITAPAKSSGTTRPVRAKVRRVFSPPPAICSSAPITPAISSRSIPPPATLSGT